MFGGKKGCAEIGGASMDYVVFGKGEKAFVILLGLSVIKATAGADMFAVMYKLFAKDYRVYFIDRRNEVPEGYSVKDMADDTAAAMKSIGIENAHLMGVSQGGMIAQSIAANYPELVDRLVLVATLSRQNDTVKTIVGKWIDYAERGDFVSLNKDSFEKLYSENYLKKNKLIAALAAKMIKPDDTKKFIILAKACLTFDGYDNIEKIKCPVFVIGGRNDKVVTGEASEEIAAKLGCKLHMYEEYGHALYDEANDFKQMVYDFLKSDE